MTRNPIPNQRAYARDELLADAIIHGGAILAALIGGGFILAQSIGVGGAKVAALIVYVLALIAMLGFSAAYNLTPASPAKWILRRFDHSAIYIMIAGTYTPLLLQLPDTTLAAALAAVVWGGAIAGVIMKVLLPGRFDNLAIGIYLALGWVGIFAAKSFAGALPLDDHGADRRRRPALFRRRAVLPVGAAQIPERHLAWLRGRCRRLPLHRHRLALRGLVTCRCPTNASTSWKCASPTRKKPSPT
jgi:channel protein (hemolysin III family)